MKITLAYPNIPDGEKLEVTHLGVFPNGETSDVSEQQVKRWEHETGREWPGDLVLPSEEVQSIGSVPSDAEFPHHKGGGMYILSDGSEVKGKEDATKAQDDLNNAGGE